MSMAEFTFLPLNWKYAVLTKFGPKKKKKIKIISLSWNLVPTLTRICKIHW